MYFGILTADSNILVNLIFSFTNLKVNNCAKLLIYIFLWIIVIDRIQEIQQRIDIMWDFFYCYRTSLKPFQTVHSIRPLAGTMIMTANGANIGGGGVGGLVLYLVIINLLWSTGGFFGKTKVGCPGASRWMLSWWLDTRTRAILEYWRWLRKSPFALTSIHCLVLQETILIFHFEESGFI